MLDFISTLLEEGISTNCTDKKSGRSFISKEGLIAIVKDSVERNKIDNVMSVLINGPRFININKEVLLIAINNDHPEYKDVKIINTKINQVNQTIRVEISYFIERYSREKNNTRDTRYAMNEDYKYPVMVNYKDYVIICFDDCYKAEAEYNENHTETPVEESTNY